MTQTHTQTRKNGCPAGYEKRLSYKSASGRSVPARCVETQTKKACPPGKLMRKAYVRRFRTNVRERGYTVKRGNQMYRVYPKSRSTIVDAACIKDRGLPGRGPDQIGPLRKGELLKYGYVYRKSDMDRHEALRKAVKEFGALSLYRKLDAVSKLSKRTAPKASNTFKKDREWVRRHFGPLKAV